MLIQCCTQYHVFPLSIVLQITIYERIISFESLPKWVPHDQDQATGKLKDPLGTEHPQMPQNTNVTFIFNYTQGTIEQLEFRNVTNGQDTLIDTFNVTDKFDARSFRVSISFPFVSKDETDVTLCVVR